MVPTVVCVKFGIFPPLSNLMKGFAMVCMIYIPLAIAEVLTYVPILGSGASYLVFVTGNLTNLKIPCATMCMDAAGVKPATEEGDIIATISAAVSSIVTVLIILVGMLAIVPLTPVLSAPVLAPAFSNILPALFGGLGAYWLMKQWQLAIVPLVLTVLIYTVFSIPAGTEGVLIPVMGLISVLSARLMYKKGWIR